MRQFKIPQALEKMASSKPERRAVEVEESLDQLSRWMDGLFRIPGVGWRFGLDALIGLIPGVGDTATSVVSFYILAKGVRYRVPKITLVRMGLNIAIDYVVGVIPVVGDLFDFVWKSNQKNVELLRERATVSAEEGKEGRTSDWLFVALIIALLIVLLVTSIVGSVFILAWLADKLTSLF